MVACCHGNPTAEVEEEGDRVLVKVRGDTNNHDCADTVCVELDRSLTGAPSRCHDGPAGTAVRVAGHADAGCT
jgi:hypothetical protein